MHSVEMRELETFLALADELHFGRAAQRMGISQSRVSQTLRDLERKLGTILLRRSSRRVALTPAGEKFRSDLTPIYSRLTQIVENATAPSMTGVIRLVLMYPNLGADALVRLIDAFEESYGGCHVEVSPAPLGNPALPLRSGEADLLVTTLLRDPTGLNVITTLGVQSRVLAVAVNHRLAHRAEVTVEDLANEKVAAPSLLPDDRQEAWVPFHTPSGQPIERIARRPASDAELAMLVARGKVVYPTVMAAAPHFASGNIALVPFRDLPPLPVALLALPGPMPQHVRAFVRVAKKVRTVS